MVSGVGGCESIRNLVLALDHSTHCYTVMSYCTEHVAYRKETPNQPNLCSGRLKSGKYKTGRKKNEPKSTNDARSSLSIQPILSQLVIDAAGWELKVQTSNGSRAFLRFHTDPPPSLQTVGKHVCVCITFVVGRAPPPMMIVSVC